MQTQIHHNSSQKANSLSPVQLEVLDLLLAGATVTEAAEKANLHRTTIHHWCRVHAPFIAALKGAKERRLQDVNDELRSLSGPALEALRQALTADKPAPPPASAPPSPCSRPSSRTPRASPTPPASKPPSTI